MTVASRELMNVTHLIQLRGEDKPPKNWQSFVKTATNIFVQKDTDYDSRFMRGLRALDARTLWMWEVDKKIDRIRTWIQRGELEVKGEGVNNSVVDLFNYTVQFIYYQKRFQDNFTDRNHSLGLKEWQRNRKGLFEKEAYRYTAFEWVEYLQGQERIFEEEKLLKIVILAYMGERQSNIEKQLRIENGGAAK